MKWNVVYLKTNSHTVVYCFFEGPLGKIILWFSFGLLLFRLVLEFLAVVLKGQFPDQFHSEVQPMLDMIWVFFASYHQQAFLKLWMCVRMHSWVWCLRLKA
jgi:hypothetical protein